MEINLKKLQCAMATKCYNANDLAYNAKLSNATISRILKTGVARSTQSLGKIALALDVKPQDLIQN